MSRLSFFRAPALSLAAAAAAVEARLVGGVDAGGLVTAVAPLERAEADEVGAFFDELPIEDLRGTRAGACLVAPRHLAAVPPGTVALVTDHPRAAFRRLAGMLHPESLRPGSLVRGLGIDPAAHIAPSAELEPGVVLDPGAIVGPGAEIGSGSFVGAGSIIGAGVRVGRGCAIDAGVTLGHALLGDRVVVHAGARVGQAARDPLDPRRDPQLGRVIVQNDVEIGANATVARGMLRDTVIGEGARVAPLACIGADALIERGARVAGPRAG